MSIDRDPAGPEPLPESAETIAAEAHFKDVLLAAGLPRTVDAVHGLAIAEAAVRFRRAQHEASRAAPPPSPPAAAKEGVAAHMPSREALRRRIESDPDLPVEAGVPPTPPPATEERAQEEYMDQVLAPGSVIHPHSPKPWRLRFICCGMDDGSQDFATWEEADQFREGYVNVEGHQRTGIIDRLVPPPASADARGMVQRALGYALTVSHWDPVVQQLEAEILDALAASEAARESQRKELDMLRTGGIIEVMIRNPNVDSWVREWEKRALDAESQVTAERQRAEQYRKVFEEMAKEGRSWTSAAIRDVATCALAWEAPHVG